MQTIKSRNISNLLLYLISKHFQETLKGNIYFNVIFLCVVLSPLFFNNIFHYSWNRQKTSSNLEKNNSIQSLRINICKLIELSETFKVMGGQVCIVFIWLKIFKLCNICWQHLFYFITLSIITRKIQFPFCWGGI